MLQFVRDQADAEAEPRVLYHHQAEALLSLHNHFQRPGAARIALVCLPTGTGKSTVAVMAPYLINSTRTLVLNPSPTISEQLIDAFKGNNRWHINPDDQKAVPPVLVERGIVARENFRTDLFKPMCHFPTTREDTLAAIVQHEYHAVVVNFARAAGRGDDGELELIEFPSDAFDLVIVDEAHHYPAAVWRRIVEHFAERVVFLTATKHHREGYILGQAIGRPDDENPPVYELTVPAAIERGIIRQIELDENFDAFEDLYDESNMLVRKVRIQLNEHDRIFGEVRHKALIFTLRKDEADAICEAYNNVLGAADDECAAYYGANNQGSDALLRKYKSEENPRVLVICGKLLEGFDYKPVSVLGIYRNIGRDRAPTYTQFVGRAVRRCPGEPVDVRATVIAHPDRHQRHNHLRLTEVNDAD
jgi:superfamily II DNA or RNA helicase